MGNQYSSQKRLHALVYIFVLSATCVQISVGFLAPGLPDGTGSTITIRPGKGQLLMQADPKYIILGGGTAGLVLANKLTAPKDNSVLVLEAGSAPKNPLISAPAGAVKLFQSAVDWIYHSKKDEGCNDRDIYLCRGKTLGGSSCVNVMLYHRGNEEDYRKWEEQGAEGWGPADVLPYFKQAENNKELGDDNTYHNRGGMVDVEHVRYQNPLSKMFLDACKEFGITQNDDFNNWSRSQEGFGRFQVQQKRGKRWHTAMSYLKKALKRENLTTETGAHITKILIENNKAVGVEYIHNNVKKTATVAEGGEVILCSGAISSPHLLMLSGVGPAEHLEEKGIPVKKNLPGVGLNLQDHPAANVYYDINEPIAVTDKLFKKGSNSIRPSVALQWAVTGTGPLTTVGCDHGAFVKTSEDLSSPDLQIRFLAARGENPDGIATLTEVAKQGQKASGLSFQLVSCRPESTGSVRLQSSNPFDSPEIKTGFLKEEADIATLRNGIRMARKLASTKTFEGMVGKEVYPGAEKQTDEEIDDYIRNTVHTANAIVGTCKIGKTSDPLAVVDAQLKVHGIQGLRVVDASVMPCIIGGQTGAPTVMIAEKAADLILAGESVSDNSSQEYQQSQPSLAV
mmetsp:Transcript_30557/g.40369  ORF Transcript_30557/g.40369 Transcript_30557/m.40369 type:complete len:624 (+) Transcript_30557:73-1944(+)